MSTQFFITSNIYLRIVLFVILFGILRVLLQQDDGEELAEPGRLEQQQINEELTAAVSELLTAKTADSGLLEQQQIDEELTAAVSKILTAKTADSQQHQKGEESTAELLTASLGFENVTCIPRVCQQPKQFLNGSEWFRSKNRTGFTLLASFPGSGNTWLRSVSRFLKDCLILYANSRRVFDKLKKEHGCGLVLIIGILI
jgi:hypothetical protein